MEETLGLWQGRIAGETDELGGEECGACVTCAWLGGWEEKPEK